MIAPQPTPTIHPDAPIPFQFHEDDSGSQSGENDAQSGSSPGRSEQAPRVLLVDDNESMLISAAAALEPGCVVVGTARDGRAALDAAAALNPQVIVLDISMPGMSGIEVATRLRSAGITTPIVFLTVHDEEELMQAAKAAGGIGYVLKQRLSADLEFAVREAMAGRPFVSPIK